MSEVLGRLNRIIQAQGPDSLLLQARDALAEAYQTIAELHEKIAAMQELHEEYAIVTYYSEGGVPTYYTMRSREEALSWRRPHPHRVPWDQYPVKRMAGEWSRLSPEEDSKPWHDAVEGDVWLITYEGNEYPAIFQAGRFRDHGGSWEAADITTIRKLWTPPQKGQTR